jgi:hypothetical protein
MNLPNFFLSGLKDALARQNFTMLRDYLKAESPWQGFRLVTAKFTALGEQSVPHNLGVVPQDIVVTQKVGNAILVWNYSKFTKTDLSVTVEEIASPTYPTTVRLLVGTLNQGAS